METTGQDMRFCGRYGQLHYRVVEPTHPHAGSADAAARIPGRPLSGARPQAAPAPDGGLRP